MAQSFETVGSKPLSGVRVLDFTRVLAGPYCTALMADLGADVIKIESPGGDDYRHIGPFRDGESLLFQAINRGKRSIAMNLKSAEAVAQVKALARTADVLVENFRPGVMDKLGLGPAALREENPSLVYVSLSGFGQTGPNAMQPAYDIIIQAMSGLMDMTGDPKGQPTMVGEAIADVAGGLFAAWGAMVGLFERERSGNGRHIDIALFDSVLAMMPTAACRTLLAEESPRRSGNRHPLSAPFGTYAASDGHYAVAVLNDKLFAAFCAVIDRLDLVEDRRFLDDDLRRTNEPALAQAIESWSRARSVNEVVGALSAAGIPAAGIGSVRQAWESPQAAARGLASAVAHPELGPLMVPEQPVHFGTADRGGRRAAPRLDEHRDAILALLEEENTP